MTCNTSLQTFGRVTLTAEEQWDQFGEALVLCGIPDAGCSQQGLQMASDFVKLSLSSGIKDLQKLTAASHVSPTPTTFPPAAGAAPPPTPATPKRGVDIPYVAWLNLHALLAYTISLQQCHVVLNYADLMADELTQWCEYVQEEYGIDRIPLNDPLKLKNLEDWFDFKEALHAWALDMHGHSLDTPLAYLLRKDSYVRQATHDRDYNSLTAKLITMTSYYGGTHYARDNVILHEVLKCCTARGIGAMQVSKFEVTRDGRAAYLTIEQMAEGMAGVASIRKWYYELLEAVKYTNHNGQMSLPKTVDILEKMFITLSKVGEELS